MLRGRGSDIPQGLFEVELAQLVRVRLADDGLEAADAVQELVLAGARGAARGLARRVDALEAEAGALRADGLDLVALDFALATAGAAEDFVGAVLRGANCHLTSMSISQKVISNLIYRYWCS